MQGAKSVLTPALIHLRQGYGGAGLFPLTISGFQTYFFSGVFHVGVLVSAKSIEVELMQ